MTKRITKNLEGKPVVRRVDGAQGRVTGVHEGGQVIWIEFTDGLGSTVKTRAEFAAEFDLQEKA